MYMYKYWYMRKGCLLGGGSPPEHLEIDWLLLEGNANPTDLDWHPYYAITARANDRLNSSPSLLFSSNTYSIRARAQPAEYRRRSPSAENTADAPRSETSTRSTRICSAHSQAVSLVI